ncbi:Thymus-specific serine protease [Entomophthora muscae]|uniref:Thymus-specific serine protease n=1 Tax=Entomophthora muscae TaxID=34485 RepID=A0ACC2TZU5_9FUNG|nr:Thymus-specific serine protease [Entomophthora muscae]
MSMKLALVLGSTLAIQHSLITQWVDHNNHGTTFQQRYLVNDTFYRTGGTAFLLLSGGAVDEVTPNVSILMDAAKEHRGTLYYLEHRFYGSSFPHSPTKYLKYLSNEMVLQDIAEFINHIGEKVIVMGDLYAADVALDFAQLFPNLAKGVIASSPQQPALANPIAFSKNVLRILNIQGGPECTATIIDAISHVDSSLNSKNHTEYLIIAAKFGFPAISKDEFAENLEQFLLLLEFNNESNVLAKICKKIVASPHKSIDKLAQAFQVIRKCPIFKHYQASKHSHDAFIRNYQQCSQLGFLPTQHSIIPSYLSKHYYMSKCKALGFPYTPHIRPQPTPKHALTLYGQFDLYLPDHFSSSTHIIQGASTSTSIYSIDPDEPNPIHAAKATILASIRTWLQ